MRGRRSSLLRAAAALVASALLALPGAASASKPPNTAVGGGYGAIAVGQVQVQGRRALLPLHCSGTRGSTCFVLVTMRARRTSDSIVGGTTVSLRVGRSATIPLPLYANGRRLLARRHHLRVKLTVQSISFRTLATRRITFTQ